MIDNYKLVILAGGFHPCDPSWNRTITVAEPCYKIYVPVAGTARLGTDTETVTLIPGRTYFISGARLKTQVCLKRMDVYWIHFMPESLYLRYLLDQIPPIQHWPRKEEAWSTEACEEINQLFPPFMGRFQPPREDGSPATSCRIQGLLLMTIARLLRTLDTSTLEAFHPRYYQLKPALEYMQSHYRENPCLDEIAARVHLAPTYFHRQFTALFKVSPLNYMMSQRLNQARHLLSSTSLSIKEIAETVGYDNPYYFSRIFTAQLMISPSRYRTRNAEASSPGSRKGPSR
jgi:AraC-like DNA-binding protein